MSTTPNLVMKIQNAPIRDLPSYRGIPVYPVRCGASTVHVRDQCQ